MSNNKEKMKKFRMLEYLNNVSYASRKHVRSELIMIMEVSESTFDRILYAKKGDKQDISATNLVRIAGYFDIKPEELFQPLPEISIGNIELVR